MGDKEEVGCLLRLLVVDGSSQEGGDAICFLRACQEALIQFCDSEIPDFQAPTSQMTGQPKMDLALTLAEEHRDTGVTQTWGQICGPPPADGKLCASRLNLGFLT